MTIVRKGGREQKAEVADTNGDRKGSEKQKEMWQEAKPTSITGPIYSHVLNKKGIQVFMHL